MRCKGGDRLCCHNCGAAAPGSECFCSLNCCRARWRVSKRCHAKHMAATCDRQTEHRETNKPQAPQRERVSIATSITCLHAATLRAECRRQQQQQQQRQSFGGFASGAGAGESAAASADGGAGGRSAAGAAGPLGAATTSACVVGGTTAGSEEQQQQLGLRTGCQEVDMPTLLMLLEPNIVSRHVQRVSVMRCSGSCLMM